jgi:pimeloyl-ACP methyl ester carboxylesterase
MIRPMRLATAPSYRARMANTTSDQRRNSTQIEPDDRRRQLLAGLPVTERRLDLAGVSTSVLEGGEGPPVVLLHGPGAWAGHWMKVLPELATTHRVVVPDLPDQGASYVDDGTIDAQRVGSWLAQLIDATCTTPPVLVGQALAGAIAATFASAHPARVGALVLVDTLGLRPFEPSPEFGAAIEAFFAQPDVASHDQLWKYCAFDVDGLRRRMGGTWSTFAEYNVDLARTPAVQSAVHAMLGIFGFPAIDAGVLDRIAVPTTLVWGRHDLATPLSVAEAASARYGWPLYVVDGSADDPAIEQPEAFTRILRKVLGEVLATDTGIQKEAS